VIGYKKYTAYRNDDSSKMRRLFGGCVGTLHGYSSRVVAGSGLLRRFIACAVLCVAKLSSEVASAGIKAAESYP
jgi:hypothetical protein